MFKPRLMVLSLSAATLLVALPLQAALASGVMAPQASGSHAAPANVKPVPVASPAHAAVSQPAKTHAPTVTPAAAKTTPLKAPGKRRLRRHKVKAQPTLKPGASVGAHEAYLLSSHAYASAVANAWPVKDGQDLHDALYDWSQRAGWTLVWNADYSYQLQGSATFNGNYASAVGQLFAALGQLTPALYLQIYQGNRVLVVKDQPNN